MSEEMRRRTKKSKLSPGQCEQRLTLGTSARPAGGGVALILSSGLKHVVWAQRIVQRFGAKRGFAKAPITDLAIGEAARREKNVTMAGAFYDQRRWVRNEFKNIVLRQLFVARPFVSNPSGGEMIQELRGENSQTNSGLCSSRHRPLLSPVFAKQISKAGAIVRRTEQVKSLELPLVLAGTRLVRRAGAGSVPLVETEESRIFELPVAKLARRHQRREIARGRVASEFAPPTSIEAAQSAKLGLARPGVIVRAPKQLPAAQQEAIDVGNSPLRGMNVTQVADEVMKQLDRRLIAARERMGKI
jgi:hypothetical protein